MFLVSACSCLYAIHWSWVLSGEWGCSWSSADRQCSNYIWVITNLIAYWSASYIRDLTVFHWNLNENTTIFIEENQSKNVIFKQVAMWFRPQCVKRVRSNNTTVGQFTPISSLIARFKGPTWGPPGANRTQVGPMLATWTLLYLGYHEMATWINSKIIESFLS